jgi:gliding motility-associated lipoprotein GldD
MRYSGNPFLLILIIASMAVACGDPPVPRPKGYFRIDLPERDYVTFDSTFPYTFEYPSYAKINPRQDQSAEPYWLDVVFPQFRGRVYLSYKRVNNNLIEYLEDSRTFVMKHIPKARSINDSVIIREGDRVYGLIYEIEGIEAASPIQFILTDSSRHFVRGALYFNFTPNNDSLKPVIDHLEKDIKHLINTFRWEQE